MSRYRKVDPRIWNDEKFRNLSDNGKLVFFMLLTHPHMTALGAMRANIPGLAADMGWSEKAFREAFGEALSKGMAKHDSGACLVALPRFLKYNPPEAPNVVKAWRSSLDLLPECELKSEIFQEAKAFAEGMTEGFGKAFAEGIGKDYAYTGAGAGAGAGGKPLAPNGPKKPDRSAQKVTWSEAGFEIPASIKTGFSTAYPAVLIDAEIAKAHAWVLANPANRKSQWGRFLNKWLERAQDKAPRVSGSAADQFKGVLGVQ